MLLANNYGPINALILQVVQLPEAKDINCCQSNDWKCSNHSMKSVIIQAPQNASLKHLKLQPAIVISEMFNMWNDQISCHNAW